MPSPERARSRPGPAGVTVTFAGSGDAFGSGGRFQACIHLRPADQAAHDGLILQL